MLKLMGTPMIRRIRRHTQAKGAWPVGSAREHC